MGKGEKNMLIVIAVCSFLVCVTCILFIVLAKRDYTELAPYIIIVNKKGELLDPKDMRRINENEYKDYIEKNIISNIIEQNKKKILIFVHGGLNTLNGALKRTKNEFHPNIPADYYPIFIIWDSSQYCSARCLRV